LQGLSRLRDAFGAEALVLSRLGRVPGAGAQILATDRRTGEADIEPVDRSFASVMLGPYLFKPRAGTTWFAENANINDDPALGRLRRRRGLSDLVVVVLEVEEKAVFFLEFHFAQRLGPEAHGAMNNLAGSLMTLWSQRATGRFSEALLKGRPSAPADRARQGVPVDLLCASNPARLSRAEFRICTLLSSGLSAAGTRKELGITESTLRSHLRQIYIKTGASNMAELLFNLLAAELPANHTIAPAAIQSAR
jgi:DNA-binding CsgD family transcriptional regulator